MKVKFGMNVIHVVYFALHPSLVGYLGTQKCITFVRLPVHCIFTYDIFPYMHVTIVSCNLHRGMTCIYAECCHTFAVYASLDLGSQFQNGVLTCQSGTRLPGANTGMPE